MVWLIPGDLLFKVSDTKANVPGTRLNCASSFFFLNCLRALQKHICGVASLQQHFALFNYRVPSKDTKVARAPLSSQAITMEFFLSPSEVGCVTTQCTYSKNRLGFSFFGNRTYYEQTQLKGGHLAPQTAGSSYSVSC